MLFHVPTSPARFAMRSTAAIGLALTTSQIHAQANAHAWETNSAGEVEWHVSTTTSVGKIIDKKPEQAGEEEIPDITNPVPQTEALLNDSSQWLMGLGFRGPLVETMTGQDAHVYIARLADSEDLETEGAESVFGIYKQRSHELYLHYDLTHFALGRGKTHEEQDENLQVETTNTATAVHELFHGVQHNYREKIKSILDAQRREDNPKLDWIEEGTAEAVTYAWLRKTIGGDNFAYAPRLYDVPLHLPDEGDRKRFSYATSHFWLELGNEVLDSRDDIQYLHKMFERFEWPSTHGLNEIHEALKHFSETGLYDLYPAFIAREADHERFFDEISQTTLTNTDGENEELTNVKVKPVATRAHQLSVSVPAGRAAGLEIRLKEDHPDLHLIVDSNRYDHAPTTPGGDRNGRNTFRTVLYQGTGSEAGKQEFFVRVAHVAKDDPAASGELSYTLEMEMKPLNPCSQEQMVSVLNEERIFIGPYRPDGMSKDPLIPKEAQIFMQQHRRKLEPGTGELNIRGLINDGGCGCGGHVSATSLLGRAMTGEAYADEVAKRFEKIGEQLDRILPEDGANISPEDAAKLGKQFKQLQDTASSEAKGKTPNIVFPIYTPNAYVWQAGILPDSIYIKHQGHSGWQDNAAAFFVLHLPDTAPEDLRENETYKAVAHAPQGGGKDIQVPTNGGFYSRWRGEFEQIPYPPPSTPEQAENQRRRIQECKAAKKAMARLRNRLGGNQRLTGEMAEKRDCNYIGTAFEGMRQRLYGRLTGTVTVENITGAEIIGSFELSGECTLVEKEYQFRYDKDGRLTGNSRSEKSRDGPIKVTGKLRAPNIRHGQLQFGYEAIVIEPKDE